MRAPGHGTESPSPSGGMPWSPWSGRRRDQEPSVASVLPWSWPWSAAVWPAWLSPLSVQQYEDRLRGRTPRRPLLAHPCLFLSPCPSHRSCPGPDPFLAGAQYEEGLNALLLEVRIALTTTAWLHLVVPIQVLQCSPSDVNAAVRGQEVKTLAFPPTHCGQPDPSFYLPGPAPSLHVVGQGHIVGPDIELPFPQAEDTTMHTSAVDAHTHVHVHTCHLTHQPARTELDQSQTVLLLSSH